MQQLATNAKEMYDYINLRYDETEILGEFSLSVLGSVTIKKLKRNDNSNYKYTWRKVLNNFYKSFSEFKTEVNNLKMYSDILE